MDKRKTQENAKETAIARPSSRYAKYLIFKWKNLSLKAVLLSCKMTK